MINKLLAQDIIRTRWCHDASFYYPMLIWRVFPDSNKVVNFNSSTEQTPKKCYGHSRMAAVLRLWIQHINVEKLKIKIKGTFSFIVKKVIIYTNNHNQI